jgi:hypothetical protein
MSSIGKTRVITAIVCVLAILLFTDIFKIIVGAIIILGIVSMMDWSGDGDGRQFPGRWRKE